MLVVDLSIDVAGRFCAKLLAMGGAEVVGPTPGSGWIDRYLGAHTRSVDAPAAYAGEADVVITSFDAGRYDAGVGEDRIRSANPDVVHVTTSTFGTTGPYARLRGGPIVDWAAGGYLFITGEPDREPLMGPTNLCGYVTGYTAAIAAMAGLARRRITGNGVHADISAMESMLSVHQSTFSRLAAGIVRTRTGRYTEVYPLVVQPCRDGYVSLGITLDEEYDRFVTAIDQPELAIDPRFADRVARAAHVAEFDDAISEFLETHDAEQIVELLQTHRVPCSKVDSVSELLANPQLNARGFWDETSVDEKPARMPGNPLPVTSLGVQGSRPPPPSGLEGAVVLDFSAFWAGPSATRTLADLGADVIRIERPGSRVDTDEMSLEPSRLVQEVFFDWKMNRGKRSVVIDLKSPEGLEVIRRLAARADVIVENFRPGVMASFGLDPVSVAAVNPGIVYVSLSGFGSTGPRGWWGSYGPTIEAASSIEFRTGYAGGPPLRLGHTLPDGIGGLVGTLAALSGLQRRHETGVGAHYDVSQLEAYAAVCGEEVLAVSVTGTEPERRGNSSPEAHLQGVYRCRGDDQWVAVSVAQGAEAEALALVIGTSADPEAALNRFAIGRTKEEVAEALQAAGLAAFGVLTPVDLAADPHLAVRGYFAHPHLAGRSVPLPGSAIVARPALVQLGERAPRFGEHTRQVVAALGLDPDALESSTRGRS